jgi:hypothetical protein
MNFKRLLAFFLDLTLISFIINFISNLFLDKEKLIILENGLSNLSEKILIREIGLFDYIDSSFKIVYEIDNLRFSIIVIALLISLIYFVIFPYLSKGQTLFKAVFNLRIETNNNLSLIKILIRESFKTGIVYYLVMIVSMILFSNYYGYIVLFSIIMHCSIGILTIKQLILKKELWYEKLSKTRVIEVKNETLYGTRVS